MFNSVLLTNTSNIKEVILFPAMKPLDKPAQSRPATTVTASWRSNTWFLAAASAVVAAASAAVGYLAARRR